MKKLSSKEKKNVDLNEISEMLKSVAHPGRIAIINLLCNCGCERMTVKNIYERLKIEQSVASKHLGILRRSGLMKRETEGNNIYFKLNMDNDVTVCITNCLRKQND